VGEISVTAAEGPLVSRKPQGLGGWLLWHVIGIPVSIVANLLLILGWVGLETSGPLAGQKVALLLRLLGALATGCAALFAGFAFFRRRAGAPARMKLLMVASAVQGWLNVFALSLVGYTLNAVLQATVVTLGAWVWIAYFDRSMRVRNTFTR
jgi:hypothetical protein